MNANEKITVPTLGERFKNHPCGQYCLQQMPDLEGAELWQRPVIDCLFLRPVITYRGSLAIADQRSGDIVECWTGVSCKEKLRGEFNGRTLYVQCNLVLDESLPEEEEDQPVAEKFVFNWCEAVLSYDPTLTATRGRILGRRAWCWSHDEDAITEILTRLARQNLSGPFGDLLLPSPPRPDVGPMTGFASWENWRRVQTPNVRVKLDALIPRLIKRGFPVQLLADNL